MLADGLACAAFEQFLNEYPLDGDSVIEGERRRLRRDVRTWIEDDWDDGRPRAFIAAERWFGKPTAAAIPTDEGPLFVVGRIDRTDVAGGITLVRDLKTGRPRPREREQADANVDIDLQLALYVAVATGLASEWAIPPEVAAAYAYVDRFAPVRERAFRVDRAALQGAGAGWFALAMALIRGRLFVRTPRPSDCGICPFSPVCGDDPAGSLERLRDATGALGTFRDLKG